LLYGAENWSLAVPQKKRIDAAEIKLLRPLAGYTLRDHKYNDDIRSELGVQSITEILDTYLQNKLARTLIKNGTIPRTATSISL
jgi:hypothetical protein